MARHVAAFALLHHSKVTLTMPLATSVFTFDRNSPTLNGLQPKVKCTLRSSKEGESRSKATSLTTESPRCTPWWHRARLTRAALPAGLGRGPSSHPGAHPPAGAPATAPRPGPTRPAH